MSVNVAVKDNSKTFLTEFEKKIGLALLAIGEKAESYAKRECPVDTGRLRNSIGNKAVEEEHAAYIGTNVEYAQFVEFRDNVHHENGKAHFLRDAAGKHATEYREIVKAALKD